MGPRAADDTRRIWVVAGVLAGVAILVGAVAIGRQVMGAGTTEADCEILLRVDGELYVARYDDLERQPDLTGREVAAGIPDCADTGGDPGPDEATTVAEITDVPVEDAVWWRGTVVVRRGATLPAWTDQWYDAPEPTG